MKTKSISELDKNEMKSLVKAVYKSIYKSITMRDKKHKKDTKEIVSDILDPNYVAEVDPDEISNEKRAVLYKGKSSKSEEKGVKKLKKYVAAKACK